MCISNSQTINQDESYIRDTDSYKIFKDKNFNDVQLQKLKNFTESLGMEFLQHQEIYQV